MSTIQLKGNILNFVAHVEDENLLREILEFCFSKIKGEYSGDDMPPEILAELEEAVRLSYDPANWVSQEEVQKTSKQWLTGSFG